MKHFIMVPTAFALLMAGCSGEPPADPDLVQPPEPVLGKRPKHRWREGAYERGLPMVSCVALSPDGKRCLAPHGETLMLRDLSTGALLREFEPTFDREWTELEDDIKCMAVDWKREVVVTGDGNGVLRVWDLATGKLLRAIQASTRPADKFGSLKALALSEDGRLVYSVGLDAGKRAAVKVWDLESGKLLRILARAGGKAATVPEVQWKDGHPPENYRLDLAPNTSYDHFLLLKGGKQALVSGNVGYFALWDLENDKAVWQRDDGGGNGMLVDGKADGSRIVTIPPSGQELVVRGPDGGVLRTIISAQTGFGQTALRMLPDGKRALTGGKDGDLVLWDLDQGKAVARWNDSANRDKFVSIAVTAEANMVLTGSFNTVLQLWDMSTGKVVLDLTRTHKKKSRSAKY